jgi:predicted Zn-dependent protease
MKSYRSLLKVLSLGSAVLLGGCASGPTLIPESMLAAEASAQFEQMKKQVPLSTNQRYIDQLNRIGNRIAEVAAPYIDNAQWEFVVFEDPALNAFAMPGGKIGFYTGLMELAGSDDEIAVVMGHEIAHVLLRHGNQRVSAELLRMLGGAALAYGVRERDQHTQAAVMTAYGVGTEIGAMLPYSRHHETEADEVGLVLMTMAGYNPDAAVVFWRKMQGGGGDSPPQWLSTHPNPANRIQNLERLAAELRANPPTTIKR